MTREQAAAFVFSQSVAALAEIAAMQAANSQFPSDQPYGEAAFRAVPDQFSLGHNAVLTLMQDANG
jgi:hypothetical protein